MAKNRTRNPARPMVTPNQEIWFNLYDAMGTGEVCGLEGGDVIDSIADWVEARSFGNDARRFALLDYLSRALATASVACVS